MSGWIEIVSERGSELKWYNPWDGGEWKVTGALARFAMRANNSNEDHCRRSLFFKNGFWNR